MRPFFYPMLNSETVLTPLWHMFVLALSRGSRCYFADFQATVQSFQVRHSTSWTFEGTGRLVCGLIKGNDLLVRWSQTYLSMREYCAVEMSRVML